MNAFVNKVMNLLIIKLVVKDVKMIVIIKEVYIVLNYFLECNYKYGRCKCNRGFTGSECE